METKIMTCIDDKNIYDDEDEGYGDYDNYGESISAYDRVIRKGDSAHGVLFQSVHGIQPKHSLDMILLKYINTVCKRICVAVYIYMLVIKYACV